MSLRKFTRSLFGTMFVSLLNITNAYAEVLVEPRSLSEFWLNPGFYSYHFQKDIGLNNVNEGLGIEYRYSSVSAVTAGYFRNSDWQTSRYAGWYWQPLALGPARIGAVFGVLDGYPRMNNGGGFIAGIPTISVEYKSIGANLMLIPTYEDRLHGALSLQIKLKIF